MTGLIERGADLLVTVSPLARCYIFITWVLYLSSMNENPSIAGVKTISPAPLLTGKKKKKRVCERACECVGVGGHLAVLVKLTPHFIKSSETNIYNEKKTEQVGVKRSVR